MLWNKAAEFAQNYLKKGDKVYIEGQIRTRSWEAQDGSSRYTTEIVVNDLRGFIPLS